MADAPAPVHARLTSLLASKGTRGPPVGRASDLRVFVVPAGRRNAFSEYLAIADVWYGRNVYLLVQATITATPSLARTPYRRVRTGCRAPNAGPGP